MYFSKSYEGTKVTVPYNKLRAENFVYNSEKKYLNKKGFSDKYEFIEHDVARNLLIYKIKGNTYFGGRGDTNYASPTMIVAKIESFTQDDKILNFTAKDIYEIEYGKGFLKNAKLILKEFLSNTCQVQNLGEFETRFTGNYFDNGTEPNKNYTNLTIKTVRYVQTGKVFFETEMPDEIYDLVSNNWFDIDDETQKCVLINEVTDILEKTVKGESLKELENKLEILFRRADGIRALLQNSKDLTEENLYIGFCFKTETKDEMLKFESYTKVANKQFLEFVFFKAYKIEKDDFFGKRKRYYSFDIRTDNRNNHSYLAIGDEKLDEKYKFIKWTKEREMFFSKVESDLKDLNGKISKFADFINEQDIDLLINSKQGFLIE